MRLREDDIVVLALVKGEERYVWVYRDDLASEVLGMMGRFAADPNLSFSWRDAAKGAHQVREASLKGGE